MERDLNIPTAVTRRGGVDAGSCREGLIRLSVNPRRRSHWMKTRAHIRAVPRALVAISCLVPLLLMAIAPAQAALVWRFSTFDDDVSSGYCSSLALDSQGTPHIAYEAGANADLRYAVGGGAGWNVETIVSSTGAGACAVSLALDSNDQPQIAYNDSQTKLLKYAVRSGDSWNSEIVDDSGEVGHYASLALDAAGHPHIAYLDGFNADLKYATNDGSGWQIQAVDTDGTVGWFSSIAVDSNGQPHIAYYDYSNTRVRYAVWAGDHWDFQTVDTTIGPDPYISLALDANNVPHISYGDENMLDVKYATLVAGSWSVETIDTGSSVAMSSIVVNSANAPRIAYCGQQAELKYLVKDQTGWHIQTVATGNNALPSLVLDSRGLAHISYLDNANLRLVYTEQTDDSTPPVTTASATADGASYTFGNWTNQPVTVTLDATDDTSGVASTYYALDSGSQQTYSTPFTISTEGAHTLSFWSVDNANNVETAQENQVNIDLTPPSITIT
ncbi:MAG TPA: hypothetical protein VHA53_11430, partial [Nitrolancea sp.]|nr:hypothetical protein [Nitrolancea sp.]